MLIPKLLLPNSQLFGSGSNNRHKIQTAIVLRVNSDLENHSGYFQEYLLGQNFKKLEARVQREREERKDAYFFNLWKATVFEICCCVTERLIDRLTDNRQIEYCNPTVHVH